MACLNPNYKCVYQYGLLGVLILLGASQGVWQEILGPTLPSLSSKLNVSYESMGYLMSFRSIGNVAALLLAAIVYDSFPFMVHYLMFAECLLAGICTIIIPWCRYYWVVIMFFITQSCCQYALNNGGQLTVLRTFKDRAIGKMQLYHLGYGIGGVMSGLISQPFLRKTTSSKLKLTKYCMEILKINAFPNFSSPSNVSIIKTTTNKGFEYIYLIAGSFAICSATIFLFYKYLREPDHAGVTTKKKESWLMKINPKYTANGKTFFGSVMTVLLFLYYFFYIFGLVTFSAYMVVYAIDPCKAYKMTIGEATYLHTALNLFFLLGRVVGSFIINRNPIMYLLIFNTLNIGFTAVLVSLSHKYSLALWIGACGMRLCNSIVYPSGTSFVNRYIVVSSSLISLAFFGATVGSFVGSSVGGYLVDNYPSSYITYSCISGMVMHFVTIIAIMILGVRNGLRDFSNENGVSKTSNVELK